MIRTIHNDKLAFLTMLVLTCFVLKKVLPKKEGKLAINILAWGAGVAMGLLSLFSIVSVTRIPLIDACLSAVGAALLGVLSCRKQKAYEEEVAT